MQQDSQENLVSTAGVSSDRWVDLRLVSAMRVVLAAAATLVILIDAPSQQRLVWVIYPALILYTIYSLAIYILTLRRNTFIPQAWLHWLDLLWYLPFLSLSSATNSIFFFFLFFSIMVASFGWGFSSGLRMTMATAGLFTLAAIVSPSRENFEMSRFMLRPIFLLALGYMIAHWGGYEVKLKSRLALLNDISSFSDPRVGIEQTVQWMMERLRRFYNAESCLLVLAIGEGKFHLRKVTSSGEDIAKDIPKEMASLLLSPSPPAALVFQKRASGRLVYDVKTGSSSKQVPESFSAISNTLEADSFVSLPVYYHNRPAGRFYVISSTQSFNDSDIAFVLQLIEHITPVLDNIRLADRLASEAAEYERLKIARDIHDSVIQPYIGLQLGLTAIRQKIDRGDDDVGEDVRTLAAMTVNEIEELRHYIRGLKKSERHDTMLVPAVRRFATKFSTATGIAVEVKAADDISVKDRFAAEIFQMITEGFSNIRRHTHSVRAEAELVYRDGLFNLRIKNENPNGSRPPKFHPLSLAERAAALGGKLIVEVDPENKTVVDIEIPL